MNKYFIIYLGKTNKVFKMQVTLDEFRVRLFANVRYYLFESSTNYRFQDGIAKLKNANPIVRTQETSVCTSRPLQ